MAGVKGKGGVKGRSGGARSGSGRPASSKRLKVGDQFYASRQTQEGTLGEGRWTVSEVGRGKLVFKCAGETITLIS